jgi:hypothetical protein
MISHFDDVKIDAEFWSQQLSFWFAGIIVFGSVRGFVKLLTRVCSIYRHNNRHILIISVGASYVFIKNHIFNKQQDALCCTHDGHVFLKCGTHDAIESTY